MIKIAISALALTAVSIVGAAAQGSSVVLEGEVAPSCTLTGEGFSGFPDTIQRDVDLSNPQALPNVTLNMHVLCTESFRIAFIPEFARFENINAPPGTLQDALIGDSYLYNGSPTPDFVGGLKYNLDATLGGVRLPSGGGGPSYISPGFGAGVGFETFTLTPRSAPLLVTFDPIELPPSLRLLAGQYRERITIQLTPQGV